MSLQVYQNNYPSQDDLNTISTIARTAHASGLYNTIGGEARILMILLTAKELGIGPMMALNGSIWNIQGKIEISARCMNGMIRKAGHSIKIIKSDNMICTLLGTRKDGDSFECSFSIEDATRAGLAKRDVWLKYTEDMLYNRCMSRLARRLFSDIIGESYIQGEIADSIDITHQDITKSNNIPVENVTKSNIAEKETTITQEELETLLEFYEKTDDKFKENFEKYMLDKWNVKEFKNIPSKAFVASMNGITKNIEMNNMGI